MTTGKSPSDHTEYAPPDKVDRSDEHLLAWLTSVLGPDHEAVRCLARTIAEDPTRITRAYRQVLHGYTINPVELLKPVHALDPEQAHGVVLVQRIPFMSICAHHFLPYLGHADVAYEPSDRLLGIGKLPRLVAAFASRLQLQELLGEQIVRNLMDHGKARGAWVEIEALHVCMTHRGPTAGEARTCTVASAGTLVGWEPTNVRRG